MVLPTIFQNIHKGDFMKESILAIYNTLGKLQMPPTPDNAKHMAGIYIKLEELFAKAAELEKQEEKNGGD
jgi:hypothetical protein